MGEIVAIAGGMEAALAARWFAGVAGLLRLEDGRTLRVIYPGIPGPGPGPDARDVIIEIDHDLVRGDVEFHLRASGWFAHGHHRDPAYRGVILHVVERNDLPLAATAAAYRTPIPIAVLPAAGDGEPAATFTPPCVFARARHPSPSEPGSVLSTLERLGERRLRMKAARLQPLVPTFGPGGVLYAGILEILGGPANRAAFAGLARDLPLAALLDRAARPASPERRRALVAELRYAGARRVLQNAGQRPLAAPGRRLELAAGLVDRLWPAPEPSWPSRLAPGAPLLPHLQGAGLARGAAIEVAVNAILPAALAGEVWPEADVVRAWHGLPAPATYGRLRRLRAWLETGHAAGEPKPFAMAGRLQGGLLLHADYCARGQCGRCPLS